MGKLTGTKVVDGVEYRIYLTDRGFEVSAGTLCEMKYGKSKPINPWLVAPGRVPDLRGTISGKL